MTRTNRIVESQAASPTIAFVGVFTGCVSLTMTLFLVYFRRQLPLPATLIWLCPSILCAAAFSPFLFPESWQERLKSQYFINSLTILGVLLLPISGVWLGRMVIAIFPVLAIAGVFRARREIAGLDRAHLFFAALIGPLWALYLFLSMETRAYNHVFAPECASAGRFGLDPFFYVAITHMIQNFRVVSTGFDGLVPLHYQVGSNFWFAGLGKMAGTQPLFSHPLGGMIVMVPAIYLGLLNLCLSLAGAARKDFLRYAVWALLAMMGLDWLGANSYYIGENCAWGVIVFLFSLPVLLELSTATSDKRPMAWGLFSLCALLTLVMAAMKISTGILWGLGVGYILVRVGGISRRTIFGLAIMALVGLLAITIFNYPGRGRETLALLMSDPRHNLLRYYIVLRLAALGSFIAPAVYLAAGFFNDRLYRWDRLKHALRAKSLIRAELVLVITFIATLTTMVMTASDGWNFANFAQWLAFPLLIASLPAPTSGSAAKPLNSLQGIFLGSTILVLILAKAILPPVPAERLERLTINPKIIRLFEDSYRHPLSLYCGADTYMDWDKLKATRINGGLAAVAAVEPFLKKFPRNLVVFVPPENHRFWTIHNCYKVPFFIPAVLGVPNLKGLPPLAGDCKLPELGYGFGEYGPGSHSAAWSDQQLCRDALKNNFSRVLILSDLDHAENNRVLDCLQFSGSS